MKTVSLELSKQLKEAGYPEMGDFYWQKYSLNNEAVLMYLPDDMRKSVMTLSGSYEYSVASPTADEILAQLPNVIEVTRLRGSGRQPHVYLAIDHRDEWTLTYESLHSELCLVIKQSISLADAAAKAWLYLKKEGLL